MKNIILHFQNISLFCISIASLFSVINYNIYKNNIYFEQLLPIVFIHSIIDFFLTNSIDLKIHHIFVFSIILLNNNNNNVLIEDRFIIIYSLLKTEISSIFYILKYYIPNNTIYATINNLTFYITFLKFRIIDNYLEIFNNNTIDIIINKYLYKNYFIKYYLIISLYGLYILNIYWFFILTKILYKVINKKFITKK